MKEVKESSTHTTTDYVRHNTTFMAPIEDVEDPEPTRTIPKHPPRAPQPPPDNHQEDRMNQRTTSDGEKTEATTLAQAIAPQVQTQRTPHRNRSWSSSLTKGIRQLEIWPQRMGHPAPTVLQRTQKSVEGIPPLPNASPIFHCRYCNKAKQHKAARGPTEYNNAYLPGTMFHMDLGFFRGPSNLTEVVRDGANPSSTTIIKNIEGNTSYLSIVDAVGVPAQKQTTAH